MLIDLLMLTLESIHPVHPVHPVHPADWTCFEIHKHRGIVASQLSVPQDSSAPHPGLLALLQDHWVTSQDFKSTAQMQFLLRIILRHGHLCKCFRSFALHVHHQRHAVLIICFQLFSLPSLRFFTMFLQFLFPPASAIAWSSWHNLYSHPQKPSLLQWAQAPECSRCSRRLDFTRDACACDTCSA